MNNIKDILKTPGGQITKAYTDGLLKSCEVDAEVLADVAGLLMIIHKYDNIVVHGRRYVVSDELKLSLQRHFKMLEVLHMTLTGTSLGDVISSWGQEKQ